MRALILRHGRVNRRALLGFSPIAFIWLAMSLRGDMAVLLTGLMLGLVLGALVMLTHEALDANLERFILSLPVSRAQLVSETYLAGLLSLALGQGLPFLMNGLGRWLMPTVTVPVSSEAPAIAVMIFFILACVIFCMLPFRFALGGQKGLLAFSVLLVITLAGLLAWKGVNSLMDAVGQAASLLLDHPGRGLLGALGVLVLGGLSLAFSIRTYGRAE